MALSANKKDRSPENILEALQGFVALLLAHLKLENETFYPQLLQLMEAKQMNTEKTQQFIEEMKKLEGVVFSFVEKFDSVQKIQGKMDTFNGGMTEIEKILQLRIESEENGVYAYGEFL